MCTRVTEKSPRSLTDPQLCLAIMKAPGRSRPQTFDTRAPMWMIDDPMKVYFTSTVAETYEHVEAVKFAIRLAEESIESSRSKYHLTHTADQADLIVYVEPYNHKFLSYARQLLKHDPIRQYPNKCFVIENTDGSAGFLPGIYVGIPLSRADYSRFRSGCYLGTINPTSTRAAQERERTRQRLFMSFRGFRSSSVRRDIFRAHFDRKDISITETSVLAGGDNRRRVGRSISTRC
jgi:hypothetical protein